MSWAALLTKKGKIKNTKKVFIFYTGDKMVIFLCGNIGDSSGQMSKICFPKRTVKNLINKRKALLAQSVFD
jgi:hypothetical protein